MRELYKNVGSRIHQLDARVKITLTLAFIIFLNLTPFKAWPAYILFLTLIISVALYSRLSFGLVQKRSLMVLPFILAAVPLTFTRQLPYVLVPVFQGIEVPYSPEGIERFASIAFKSWISVQAAIILAATSRFPDLMNALMQLRVPKIFISIIGLMWRYLFLISEEVIRMMRARASRSATMPGSHPMSGSIFWRASVTGGMAGSLFLRSLERSDRVYAAMLSRGYNGELPASEATALAGHDWWFLIIGIPVLAFLWILGMLTGG